MFTRDEIKRVFQYDPLLYLNRKTEMELIEICYEGSKNYPAD